MTRAIASASVVRAHTCTGNSSIPFNYEPPRVCRPRFVHLPVCRSVPNHRRRNRAEHRTGYPGIRRSDHILCSDSMLQPGTRPKKACRLMRCIRCIRATRDMRSRRTWETAGGHIEKGETTLDCAKRELREETGAEEFYISALTNLFRRGVALSFHLFKNNVDVFGFQRVRVLFFKLNQDFLRHLFIFTALIV